MTRVVTYCHTFSVTADEQGHGQAKSYVDCRFCTWSSIKVRNLLEFCQASQWHQNGGKSGITNLWLCVLPFIAQWVISKAKMSVADLGPKQVE